MISVAILPLFADGGSYCENEVMRASCGPDEVVVITNATYGRMKQSRCIDRNYGYLGCTVDVLEDADRKCSGKRSCEIRVPNPEFSEHNRCPRDLKPYLQAQYACVGGEMIRYMMTSWNEKYVPVVGPLCGELRNTLRPKEWAPFSRRHF